MNNAGLGHELHREIKAAEVLREHIREIAGDDLNLIRDTLEGETNLQELIARACKQIITDGGLIKGIAEVIKDLSERKDRIERRVSMTKVSILTAMETAELKSLETPSGTVSRKAVPASALILDEALIPSVYWKVQEPKLDKRAVLEALKAKIEVPGAQLSNGGETIQLRT